MDALAEDGSPLDRFRASMVIDQEMWHDGIGYDLDALRELDADDRAIIEPELIARATDDWRDVEALAELDTPAARDALAAAMQSADHEIRSAIMRYAPNLVDDEARIASLVSGLETGVIYGGLTQTLDQVETFHPQPVIDALLRGVLHRNGEVAVHLAAMVMFVHGKADSSFDWDQRPFFLEFDTPDHDLRAQLFVQLCEKVGVDPQPYMG